MNDLTATVSASQSDAEFRQGWKAILACFCVAVFAWGFGFYGQAVFLAELRRLHGWPASVISAATTCFYLAGAFLVPFVQQVLDRIGPRALLIGGAVTLGIGAAGFSNAAAPWQLFAAGLVMAVGWAATSGPAIATTLALWFEHRRGFAISLALNGASASGFTIAPLLVRLSQTIGLRRAVVECVAIGWVLLIPIILLCVWRADTVAGAAVSRTENRVAKAAALWSWHFWSVALPFGLAIAAQVGFIVHMVAFLLPLLGAAGTGLAVTLSSLAAMFGRLGLGVVIDRSPKRSTAAICFLSQACGLGLLLALPDSVAVIYCGIVLFGLSVGNVITLPPLVVHAEFDAASFGLIVGLSGAFAQFALAFAPGAFGLLHDISGSYDSVLLACIALQMAAAGLVLYRRQRW
jgi:MFS family permease